MHPRFVFHPRCAVAPASPPRGRCTPPRSAAPSRAPARTQRGAARPQPLQPCPRDAAPAGRPRSPRRGVTPRREEGGRSCGGERERMQRFVGRVITVLLLRAGREGGSEAEPRSTDMKRREERVSNDCAPLRHEEEVGERAQHRPARCGGLARRCCRGCGSSGGGSSGGGFLLLRRG